MFEVALLVVSMAAMPEVTSDSPRCSMAVRWSGPSTEVMHVRAVATGVRTMEIVGEEVPAGSVARPDSALAFELQVIEAVGGTEPPAPGAFIRVTPWAYVVDCSWTTWEGPWVEEGEETVLTIRGSALPAGGGPAHILGGLAAYPQGWWHAVRGEVHPDRGPGTDWMGPHEFFNLLAALPPHAGAGRAEGRDSPEGPPDPPLAGTIVDEVSGRPLEGVTVRLEVMGSIRAWTETDAAGRYAFPDSRPLETRTAAGELVIHEGLRITIRALHPRYGMSAKERRPDCLAPFHDPSRAPCTQYVGFTLRQVGPSPETSAPACTLSGRVRVDGRPAARSEVILERGEVEAVADAEGNFRVEGVEPGLRTLMVRRLAATTQERTVRVGCHGDGDEIRLGFELSEVPLDD